MLLLLVLLLVRMLVRMLVLVRVLMHIPTLGISRKYRSNLRTGCTCATRWCGHKCT